MRYLLILLVTMLLATSCASDDVNIIPQGYTQENTIFITDNGQTISMDDSDLNYLDCDSHDTSENPFHLSTGVWETVSAGIVEIRIVAIPQGNEEKETDHEFEVGTNVEYRNISFLEYKNKRYTMKPEEIINVRIEEDNEVIKWIKESTFINEDGKELVVTSTVRCYN